MSNGAAGAEIASGPPVLVVLGRPGHGVTRYASDLADAAALREPSVEIHVVDDLVALVSAPSLPARMHLHVTDRLFGSSADEAASRIERLAERAAFTVTLHDLPQPSDGPTGLARRAPAYSRIAAASRGVVVSSDHESLLAEEYLGLRGVTVIPMGGRVSHSPPMVPSAVAPAPIVLVAGYIYPGKGHVEAIEAAASARDATGSPTASVTCIGGPSAGHEADLADLVTLGASLGVDVASTGFLEDIEYRGALLGPGTPLVAHAHVSSSRSLIDWIEEGRRPLALRSRYTEEVDRVRPGTLTLYSEGELAEAVARTWGDPRSTWLPPGTPLGPTLDDAARDSLEWWSAVSW